MEPKNHQLNLQEDITRNNIFKNMVEINYFVIDLSKRRMSFEFSQKFCERTNIPYKTLDIRIHEFTNYVEPNYQKVIREFFRQIINMQPMTVSRFDSHPVNFPQSKRTAWMYAIVQKINDHKVYGVHVDITELKETEIALSHTKEEYETILTNATDLIASYSIDGKILFASQSYADLYNLTVEELKGKQVFNLELVNQTDSGDYIWFTRALEPPYQSTNIFKFQTNEKEKWISFYNQAIIEGDEIVSIISIGHDITTIKQLNDKLNHEATHDTLSGLYNRRGIRERLESSDPDQFYKAYLISINNMPDINDFYGFEIGDELIRVLGKVLKRYEDSGYIVGRLSGAKFVVISSSSEQKVNTFFKNHLLHQINRSYYVKDHSVYINASIGYAHYPADTTDLQQLISYAELATYEAQFVTNKTKRFHRSMFNRLHQNVRLSNDLRESLANGGLHLVYQSIVDAETYEVKYIETLARWNHPKQGVIPPNEFIEIAEKSSLLERLDLYIIEHALKDFREIRKQFPKSILTINITPITLRSPRLGERVSFLAKQHGIPPSSICLEISENTFVDNRREVMNHISRLKQNGIMVALDDFGSKYSSLSILDDIEVDIIKVDKSFIPKMPRETTLIILKMLQSLAELRKKEVVIEGVEEKVQVDQLKQLGFRLIQGYYFSYPEPITRKNWINEVAIKERELVHLT